MSSKNLVVGFLLFAICYVQLSYQQDAEVVYEDPILTAADDEIKSLPGLNDPINFRQFSGYLKADDSKDTVKFIHYWFVESQSDPTKDPLVLWLNGGPGCSSLGGLFTELGPFTVDGDGKNLKLNEFSWNKMANVLFLESPTGVGFSYSTNLMNIHTDDSTARMNHIALKSFLKKFPQFKDRPLYLSGESYAGVYLPTLGQLVDEDPEMNLKGIAIGNGYLDVNKLTDSLVLFSYHHGLIGKSTWEDISEECCSGKPPTRSNCALSGPNQSWSCRAVVRNALGVLDDGLNPYNLYAKCASPQVPSTSPKRVSNRETIDKQLRTLALDSEFNSAKRSFHVFQANRSRLGIEPPCVDDGLLIEYLGQPEVRRAIHIPDRVKQWDTCSIITYIMKYPKLPGGLAPQMKSLIESKRNLTLLVYNGDVDTVCNFLGDEWFVDDLGRKVLIEYAPWKVNNQIAGYVKHYDGIAFATVRGSGHMVPGDRPREAFAMIKAFLEAKNKTISL